MRFCTECGAQLQADARFCTHCGTPVSGAAAPPAPNTQAPRTPAARTPHSTEPINPDDATVIVGAQPVSEADEVTHIAPQAQTYDPASTQDAAVKKPSLSEQFAAHTQEPTPPARKGLGAQFEAAESGAPQTPTPEPDAFKKEKTDAPNRLRGAVKLSEPTQALPWGDQKATAPAIDLGAFNWRENLLGLIRIGTALLLAFTTIFVWWRLPFDSLNYGFFHGSDFPVYSNIFALIGCLGVMAAAITQLVIHPNLMGSRLPERTRLIIRAALVAPAVFAILLEVVTASRSNIPGPGTAMLGLAGGLALTGLDDVRHVIPQNTLRIIGMVCSGLGVAVAAITLLTFLIIIGRSGDITLLLLPNALVTLALSALVLLTYLRPAPQLMYFTRALACAVVLSYLLSAWVEYSVSLYVKFLALDGFALIPLAWALTLSFVTSENTTDDLPASAKWTSWAQMAFFVAGGCAIVQLLDALMVRAILGQINGSFIGSITSFPWPSNGAGTWCCVMMLLISGGYIAVGVLLRRSPLSRLLAVAVTVFAVLAMLVTVGSSNISYTFGTFMMAAILWLPVLSVLALTVPKSVREASGSLMPKVNSTSL